MLEAEDALVFQEALNGAPDFYELPAEYQKIIEQQVEARERFFWLASTRIKQDIVTRSLLRRAIYAEVRAVEAESRLGEMGLICQAGVKRINELEKLLADVSGAVKN